MTTRTKLFRISTVPVSLDVLLKGQLKYLNQFYDLVAISGPGEHLENVAQREGVQTIPVYIHRNINLFGDFVSLWKLFWLFKREKPDIVHSITPKAGLLSMLAAKVAGVPIRMHTFTGLIFPTRTGVMQKILIFMDRLLCKAATHVYPEGQGVRNDLIKFKITNKPLRVLANGNINGIDVLHFDPLLFSAHTKLKLQHSLNITDDDFVFVFIGRLVKDKGINELIAAFKAVNAKHPNTKLLLVGPFENDIDPMFPETVHEIDNNLSIIAVGFQNDVRPYLAISSALVFPSYREGFPNVPMQAGAMGLPSIVTDINGCNEIITHEFNGVIIPPKNQKALENAMVRMLEDKDLFQKLQLKARESIVSRFDQLTLWKLIKEEYDEQLRLAGIENE